MVEHHHRSNVSSNLYLVVFFNPFFIDGNHRRHMGSLGCGSFNKIHPFCN